MRVAKQYKYSSGERPKLCILPGEGAAAEAMLSSVAVLDALQLPLEKDMLDVRTMTNEEMYRRMDGSHATWFGAMADGVNLLGYLRWTRGTYANVRPVQYRENFNSPLKHPENIDFIVIRENLEDLYPPREGDVAELKEIAAGHPEWSRLEDGIYALKVISEKNTRNVARFAAELARKRKQDGYPGKVTIGVKDNVLRKSDGLFRDVAMEVLRAYPDIEVEKCIADALFHRMVLNPHSLDVVLLPNMLGDLLADGAAAMVGGLGLASSACIGDEYAYFEAVHGTAPDIEGKGIINPTATLLALAMAIDYLGFSNESAQLNAAIEAVYREGKALTPDQGGTCGTDEFCAAVIKNLKRG
ncbi:isocitrate/isopropylmalate family dehydrogenase [Paenibacillus elgii]